MVNIWHIKYVGLIGKLKQSTLFNKKITVEINIQGQVHNRIGKILKIDVKKLKER